MSPPKPRKSLPRESLARRRQAVSRLDELIGNAVDRGDFAGVVIIEVPIKGRTIGRYRETASTLAPE